MYQRFFKPAPKKFLFDSARENFNSNASLEKVNFVGACPLFSGCEPGVAYDIALVLGHLNQVSDAVKYQILTCRDYLPTNFSFPLSLFANGEKKTMQYELVEYI